MSVTLGYLGRDEDGEAVIWKPYEACPCGCDVVSHKLTKRGHSLGCSCQSCTGARNRAKGRAAQKRSHRDLGGTGSTPANEESARIYTLSVLPEVKTGKQIPAALDRFLDSKWYADALSQSARALPTGSGAKAAVLCELSRSRRVLVVEL